MADNLTPSPQPNESFGMEDDDEISLLDLAVVLARHKRLLIGFPLLVGIAAVVISLLLPNIYTGTTNILPPQQSHSAASAMLAQLGSAAGLVGGIAGIKNPDDLYIGMLKSRTVADNLIKRFDLNKYYKQKLASGTRATLAGATHISAGKDGIITIAVDDKDPQRAADIANAYVDELYKLTQVLAVTDASQQRLFYQHQFEQAKLNLTHAEEAARQALDKGGVSLVDAQGKAMIEASAKLRGEIAVKDVQIGAMSAYAAPGNPDLKRAQQELVALKNELAKIEGSGSEMDPKATGGGQGLASVSLLRNLKFSETVYDLLAKQYEIAKIDEAKDASLIQVMDKAIPPDRKSKPKRALIVLLSVMASFFIAILWAFISEGLSKARQDPEQAGKLEELATALSWRRR